jgi:CRP-like cAMP-binding protein
VTLKSPVAAQGRSMILDRLTATERVASFLREMSERDDDEKHSSSRCAVAPSAITSASRSRSLRIRSYYSTVIGED